VLLAALFLFAGYIHLRNPTPFLLIMPPWIPFHRACVFISGIAELLGGTGLLIPDRRIQIVTGWGLIALLVAVFPANIYMATNHIQIPGFHVQPWVAWARLPLQLLLVMGVIFATQPFAGKAATLNPQP